MAAAAVAALLALAPTSRALDGRNAVTQYAWASANCTGPIVGVLATYQLNECTESVYPGVFLYITWVRDPLTQMPDAIMYSHYQDPQCQHFLSNSSEGLMDCSARPGGFALRPGGPSDCHSKTMVYGPAQIQMTSKPARARSPSPADFSPRPDEPLLHRLLQQRLLRQGGADQALPVVRLLEHAAGLGERGQGLPPL